MGPESSTVSAAVSISATGVEPFAEPPIEQKLLARAVAAKAVGAAVKAATEAQIAEHWRVTSADHKAREAAAKTWAQYFTTRSLLYSDTVLPVFPRAYHTLINIPTLFDTLMDLERTYSLAVHANLEETKELRKQLVYSLDHSRRTSMNSDSSSHEEQSRLGDSNHQTQRLSAVEAREELMIFDATRESLLAELRDGQKAEYRDFVIKVHNELLILADQVPLETENAPVKTQVKNTDAIAASLAKLVDEGDRVLEGAVSKLKRTPSHSMMRVGSLEGLLSANNSGTNTPPIQERAEPETSTPNTTDPELVILISEVKEMGFSDGQAKAALTLAKRNLQQAIVLLLENPEVVERQIRDTATRNMLFKTNTPPNKPARAQKAATGQRSISSGSANELNRSNSTGALKRSNSNSSLQWNTTPRLPTNSPLANQKAGITASSDEVSAPQSAASIFAVNKSFSPFAFIQQQQAKISADFASITAAATGAPPPSSASGTATPTAQFNNLQKGFTNFLGKAMEALHIDSIPSAFEAQKRDQSEASILQEVSESFTAYFGTQVRTMYSFRVSIVPLLVDAVFPAGLEMEQKALRAQTAAGLYSNNLSGCILLVKASQLEGYGRGRTANRDIMMRCRQATEFHFDDVEIQIKKAMDAREGGGVVQEGDFFVTKHSNIPQVHVLFHLIVGEDDSVKELTSQSPVMTGYRNILKIAHLHDVNLLIVPMLFLPDSVSSKNKSARESKSSTTSSSRPNSANTSPSRSSTESPSFLENSAAVQKRVETVLKSTKGLIIEQTRSAKHSGDSSGVDKRSRSIQFVIPLNGVNGGAVEKGRELVLSESVDESFQGICAKVAEVFRTL
ncbi:hypothetical protein HDU79_001281 [Rhizoclosmatium sp. JEL0117]|nr:hypothetical protein HDU79_001281 [Rhizoclosmatium sp. JEL0117]